MSIAAHERILVALDMPDPAAAFDLARRLDGCVGGFKVGLELFSAAGPRVVEQMRDAGHAVFLDLKLHDIPNTVAGAAAAIGRLGVNYFTLHASGGVEMLRLGASAAAAAAAAAGHAPPLALAVTVLTSHDDAGLERIGLRGPCSAAVSRLAALAREADVAGLVCSPLEVAELRAAFPTAVLVVPGIRPSSPDATSGDDQSRTATPGAAIAAGADRLVIGRPITRAADPRSAAETIAEELRRGAVD